MTLDNRMTEGSHHCPDNDYFEQDNCVELFCGTAISRVSVVDHKGYVDNGEYMTQVDFCPFCGMRLTSELVCIENTDYCVVGKHYMYVDQDNDNVYLAEMHKSRWVAVPYKQAGTHFKDFDKNELPEAS